MKTLPYEVIALRPNGDPQSVRRLSDNTVFVVGDFVINEKSKGYGDRGVINHFWIKRNTKTLRVLYGNGDSDNIKSLTKSV